MDSDQNKAEKRSGQSLKTSGMSGFIVGNQFIVFLDEF
jgi:hypothetical protein